MQQRRDATGPRPPYDAAGGRLRIHIPFAALLFGPASIMGLMAQNVAHTTFSDVAAATAGVLVFALLVWLATAALRRSADATTAVIAAVWIIACLFHLSLFNDLDTRMGGDHTMARSLPVIFAGLVLVSAVLHRLRAVGPPLHMVLSVVALVILATPLWKAAAYHWDQRAAYGIYDADRAAQTMRELLTPKVSAPPTGAARPPDIYHFIFDRYGSADVLSAQYGQVSAADALEARGFYVAGDSHSNYLKTGHSLASTFYLDYLDVLASPPGLDGASWHPIFDMLDDHRVGRFLQARGYRFLQFGSWWAGTHDVSLADENHPHGFSEFNMLYLRRTILRPILLLMPDTPLTMRLDWDNGQCQRVARQIEQIKAIGSQATPVYVFAHILVPHGPFVFTTDGSCLTREQAFARGDHQGYIDQISYANRIIDDVVTSLQAPGRTPPVILIQADEGPFPERNYDIPWQDASADELRTKTGILNAYFFPNGDYGALRPDITPVNSYRVLFNAYFGTRFPLLPDRIMAFPNDTSLYEFHDVTDRVRKTVALGP